MYWTAFIIIGIFIVTPAVLLYHYSITGLGTYLLLAFGILIFLPRFINHIKK